MKKFFIFQAPLLALFSALLATSHIAEAGKSAVITFFMPFPVIVEDDFGDHPVVSGLFDHRVLKEQHFDGYGTAETKLPVELSASHAVPFIITFEWNGTKSYIFGVLFAEETLVLGSPRKPDPSTGNFQEICLPVQGFSSQLSFALPSGNLSGDSAIDENSVTIIHEHLLNFDTSDTATAGFLPPPGYARIFSPGDVILVERGGRFIWKRLLTIRRLMMSLFASATLDSLFQQLGLQDIHFLFVIANSGHHRVEAIRRIILEDPFTPHEGANGENTEKRLKSVAARMLFPLFRLRFDLIKWFSSEPPTLGWPLFHSPESSSSSTDGPVLQEIDLQNAWATYIRMSSSSAAGLNGSRMLPLLTDVFTITSDTVAAGDFHTYASEIFQITQHATLEQ